MSLSSLIGFLEGEAKGLETHWMPEYEGRLRDLVRLAAESIRHAASLMRIVDMLAPTETSGLGNYGTEHMEVATPLDSATVDTGVAPLADRSPGESAPVRDKTAMTRQDLVELVDDEELLFADGFDEAILGVVQRQARYIVVYDLRKCADVLVGRGSSEEEAAEHLDVVSAWVGDRTPMYLIKPEEA